MNIVTIGRGAHGSSGLRDLFEPTQKFELVGLVTQPNLKIFTTQPNSTIYFQVVPN